MATLIEAVAYNLPKLRKKAGLTQFELARKIGSTQKTVSMYEIGKGGLGTATIKKLAKALKVEETDLVRSPSSSIEKELSRQELTAVLKSFLALAEGNTPLGEISETILNLVSILSKKK